MKLLSLALLILVGGCASAPLTEDEQYKRDDKETLRLEKFYRDQRACRAGGGFIVIQRWGGSRRSMSRKPLPPSRWDSYGCERDIF